jgi:radical SAM superfamily enzyme YgiQ (UPF0313 family)
MERASAAPRNSGPLKFLLVGPYDPHCGEYTFLAPPLGVWRLAGALRAHEVDTHVFDPNCCAGPVELAFDQLLMAQRWDLIGFSTTAMTLRYDLSLAHRAKRLAPAALIIAGGMEATFKPERMFELGPPFDFLVLGEGEKPLREVACRLRDGAGLEGIPGTALRAQSGAVVRFHQSAMTEPELADAIRATPYEQMPYRDYWDRLEGAYRVDGLPFKAEREARLAEIRSVRLITLNYCPMGCSFCSSTNYLQEAQGSVARIARLNQEQCLDMLSRIVRVHPSVRTIIFQDDIFVFTQDRRILPLCEAIISAKQTGLLPRDLQFISTNRIDALNAERLTAMRQAGFRVLGFGIENFSRAVLKDFNKGQIHRHIDVVLSTALRLGITPFLDLILTSPRSTLNDLALNVRQASRWLAEGCEVGIYPYVIPFSGAAIARDPQYHEQTVYETLDIPGTTLSWRHASKILPADGRAREAILAIEARFHTAAQRVHAQFPHLPSRLRSILWIAASREVLADLGEQMPSLDLMERRLGHAVPQGTTLAHLLDSVA